MTPPADPAPVAGRSSPQRLLRALYLVFVVAAGSRSVVQWAAHPGRAPLSYGLSSAAAAVYLCGFVLLCTGRARWLMVLAVVELVGVSAVGTWTVLDPGAFAEPTVWSDFGAGYLLVPLALPVLVLLWCRAEGRSAAG